MNVRLKKSYLWDWTTLNPQSLQVKKSRQQSSKNGSMKAKKSSYSIHETIMNVVLEPLKMRWNWTLSPLEIFRAVSEMPDELKTSRL